MASGKPDRLYQQNHCGMYRTDDGGRAWHGIEAGLPSAFGFPAAAHPRDPDTLYLMPLNGDSIGRYMPDAKAACGGLGMEEKLGRIAGAAFPNRRLFLGFCGKRWRPTGLTPPVSTLAPARDTFTSALTRAIAGHALQTVYLRSTR